MNNPHNRSTNPFEMFREGWLVRREHLLDELLSAADAAKEQEPKELVARVLGQFEEFYGEKSREVHRNVFRMFSPPWCTPLECAFFWIAGFRPTVLFQIISHSINDLSPPQSLGIDGLRKETRMEERSLSDELARIQESVAGPVITDVARQMGRRRHGEIGLHYQPEEAMETLRSSTEALVANADLLRTRTAARVVEILTPRQSVKFLEASIQLQRNIRSSGAHHGVGVGTGTSGVAWFDG
ncbi:hypothetical protein Ancab_015250 [Ancistrocladus abbreviatus]